LDYYKKAHFKLLDINKSLKMEVKELKDSREREINEAKRKLKISKKVLDKLRFIKMHKNNDVINEIEPKENDLQTQIEKEANSKEIKVKESLSIKNLAIINNESLFIEKPHINKPEAVAWSMNKNDSFTIECFKDPKEPTLNSNKLLITTYNFDLNYYKDLVA